jgi:lipoyl(octanoyl) transferase
VKYQWHGLQDFKSIYEQQQQSVFWSSQREEIWGMEHPLVVSLGKRSQKEEELAAMAHAWTIIQTDRGGLATLHSPGQLVIYPLISLAKRQWGPRKYVCQLLKTTQSCLNNLGLMTQIDEESSGLFVGPKKICFVGLRVSGGRVYHGLSLNIANDLSLFDGISACGWKGRPITSFKELGDLTSTPQQVFTLWCRTALEQDLFKDKMDSVEEAHKIL